MMCIGKMAVGSKCCVCSCDLGNNQGVQLGDNDYCFPCFDKTVGINRAVDIAMGKV